MKKKEANNPDIDLQNVQEVLPIIILRKLEIICENIKQQKYS